MIVYTSKREVMQLAEKPFASGGEGAIYKVISAPANLQDTCVKIYHDHKLDKGREDRIRYMVDNPPKRIRDEGFLLGWPMECITDDTGKFLGFAMPLGFPHSKELVSLTATTINKKLGDEWHSRYERNLGKKALLARLKLINNIAIPVHILHSTGKYVLKDFKPQNVLATADGRITICDMDSIQIAEGNKLLYPGTAATPDYMPPEFYLKGVGRKANDVISPAWDTFSLGVVFYQLLFGIHPYVATPKKEQEDGANDISHNIATGLFPFGVNGDMVKIRPKLHNNFMLLPEEFQELFIRTFTDDMKNRPSAEEWGRYVHQEILKEEKSIEIEVYPPKDEGDEEGGEEGGDEPEPRQKEHSSNRHVWGWALGLVATAIIGFLILKPDKEEASPVIDSFVSEQTEMSDQMDEGKSLYEKAKQATDSAQIKEFMIASAGMGYAPAQFEVGRIYHKGYAVSQNYSEALRWYQKAVEQGNTDAMAWMSSMYITGDGVEKDYDKALDLIRRSAEEGNGYGQSNLGYMYHKGYGVEKNEEEAFRWFKKAADQNNEWGISWVSAMYRDGICVEKNYSEALRLLKKWLEIDADESNNLYCMTRIGLIYYDGGYGVEQDYAEAHRWFRKAAEKGYAAGMYNVGNDYYYGNGVPKDIDKAKEWLEKARKGGIENAKTLLGIIASDEEKIINQSNQDSYSSSSSNREYTVDGITYSTASPTSAQISSWKSRYKSICANKIRGKTYGYAISDKMISNDPCLVYLILNSKTLAEKEEKNSWFHLYESMTAEQTEKLYDILYREAYKAAAINYKYEQKQAEINRRYNQ